MIVKSVIAGEYTAPPAQGPMMAEICGTTPDARAARVVETDDRRAHLHREIHDLHDLRGVGFGERSAEDREVLRERVGEAAADAAVAGDDPVARNDLLRHPEVETAVRHVLVDLFEGAGIEEKIDALARRQLARFALAAKPLLAAAQLRAPIEIGENVVH